MAHTKNEQHEGRQWLYHRWGQAVAATGQDSAADAGTAQRRSPLLINTYLSEGTGNRTKDSAPQELAAGSSTNNTTGQKILDGFPTDFGAEKYQTENRLVSLYVSRVVPYKDDNPGLINTSVVGIMR